jgi:hypothetical protein
MKFLLSNGCSHTAGGEIEYQWQPTCYDKAWPKKLANKIKHKSINISKSGNSNQSIYRTTLDWVYNNVVREKKINPKDLTVIVMWSGFDRSEIFFPDTNIIDSINPFAIADRYNTELIEEIKKLQKLMITFQDNLVSDYRSLNLVHNLSTWLDSFGVKHYFINGIYHFPEMNYLNESYSNHAYYMSYKTLLELYGENKIKNHYAFSDPNETFYQHMITSSGFKPVKHSNLGHFDGDGHEYWAEKMYNRYFKQNLI